jgi:hypothetical protein
MLPFGAFKTSVVDTEDFFAGFIYPFHDEPDFPAEFEQQRLREPSPHVSIPCEHEWCISDTETANAFPNGPRVRLRFPIEPAGENVPGVGLNHDIEAE